MGWKIPPDVVCLVSALLSFFGFMLVFVTIVLGYGADLPKAVERAIPVLLWILVALISISYVSGLAAIIKKMRAAPIRIWMVIIGWMITLPLFYIALGFLLSSGESSGGSFP